MKIDKLPPLHFLLKLALESNFPATREDVLINCAQLGLEHHVDDFIQLFPYGELFANRSDFLERCEELELHLQPEMSL